jgi:hypothetical protein
MKVISSAEFSGNTEKYLDLASAKNEKIVIRRGDKESFELTRGIRYKKPDADFYRAISGDEFRRRAHEMIDRLYQLPR